MSTRSTRKITVTSRGDVDLADTFAAAENTSAPGVVELKTLALGDNTITVPTGGSTPTAVTIVPPDDNTSSITIKGVTGDTGVRIHDSDPTSLAFDDGVASFLLVAGAEITGVRLIWT